jgi:uncharacterized protein (TIGR02270 family)
VNLSFDQPTPPKTPILPADARLGESAGSRLLASSGQFLASQYSDMLAHEWRMRRLRSESTSHDFAHLRRTDQRIQAYLDGFALLGPGGATSLHDRLHEALSGGELFALTAQSLIVRDAALARACIGLVQAMPGFTQAFCAALEWVGWQAVEFALSLWPAEDVLRQAIVLRSIAGHSLPVEPSFVAGCVPRLFDAPFVQLSALRCALSTGEPGWAQRAPEMLTAPAPEVRLAAAEAMIVFGDEATREEAMEVLQDLALGSGRVASMATRELMTLGGRHAHELLEELGTDAAKRRQLVTAMGWSGDLAHLPRLISILEEPHLARAAGEALTLMTGSDPFSDGWAADEQQPAKPAIAASDAIPPRDPDAELPRPDPAKFAAWWTARHGNFQGMGRCLAGQPRSIDSMLAILRGGRLAHRPQASWLLQLATRGGRVENLAPVAMQVALINAMTEATKNG